VEHEKTSGTALFDAAAIYALAMEAAGADEQLDDAGQAERQAAYQERSMELLTRAGKTGLFDTETGLKRLQSDVLLDPLRERGDFKQFVKELEADEQE
jgi:hypothetical protein